MNSTQFTGHASNAPLLDDDGDYDEPVRGVRGISTTIIDTETMLDMIAGSAHSGVSHGVTLPPEEVLRLTKAESFRIVNDSNNNNNNSSATSAPSPSLDPQTSLASEELFLSTSRTDSDENENEISLGELDDAPSVTLATEQVLQLTMNNVEDEVVGEEENIDNNNPADSPVRQTPKKTTSQRNNPKRSKSGSSTSSTGKLKKAVKKEKKSMEAVVEAAIRNYGTQVSKKSPAGEVSYLRKTSGSGKKKKQTHYNSKTKSGNSSDEACEGTSAKKKKKRGRKPRPVNEDNPAQQQQQAVSFSPSPLELCDQEEEVLPVNENENNGEDEDEYDLEAPLPPQLSEQISSMSFQSIQSIDRAGAIAVFPSESSHTTQRRSIYRPISDIDQDIDCNQFRSEEFARRGSSSRDLTSTNKTYEEIPEPPESQVINATATLFPSQQDSLSAAPTTRLRQTQTQMPNQLPPPSVGSRSLTIPSAASATDHMNATRLCRSLTTQRTPLNQILSRDSSSDNDDKFLGTGSLVNDETRTAGTVTAKAISSEDYYAEVRRQLQKEAVVAVDVVPVSEDGLPLHNMTSSSANSRDRYGADNDPMGLTDSRKSDQTDGGKSSNQSPDGRNKNLWICSALGGGILIVALIIAVSFLTIKKQTPDAPQIVLQTQAPSIDNDDMFLDPGDVNDDSMSQEMLDMTNSEMGMYWRRCIGDILPNDSLLSILSDPNYMNPQYMSFIFLVENAEKLFGIHSNNHEMTALDKSKVRTIFALVSLYHSLDGPNWFVNHNWLQPDKNFCEWHGVNCKGDPIPKQKDPFSATAATDSRESSIPFKELLDIPPRGDLDDLISVEESSTSTGFGLDDFFGGGVFNEGADDDHVSGDPYMEVYEADDAFNDETWDGFFDDKVPIHSLDLQANGLFGTIPNEIGLLTNIYGAIDLSTNSIEGSIPSHLGMLSKLQCMVIHTNELENELPTELGSMTNLRKFDVSGNSAITGTVPYSLKNWSKIEVLEVQNTGLCGRVPMGLCETLEFRPTDFVYKHGEELAFRASCQITRDGDGEGLDCGCCTECCYLDGISLLEQCVPAPSETDD